MLVIFLSLKAIKALWRVPRDKGSTERLDYTHQNDEKLKETVTGNCKLSQINETQARKM